MKNIFKIGILVASTLLFSCGGDAPKKETKKKFKSTKKKIVKKKKEKKTPPSQTIDFTTKGYGPIKSISIDKEVNTTLATKGEKIYKSKCTACHKLGKKFIGPDLTNVTKRRSPEWIMNMVLNPMEMVQKDELAKKLLMEFNGAPMANQNLTEEDARAVLEYFRTL